jgi:hypothetical protein
MLCTHIKNTVTFYVLIMTTKCIHDSSRKTAAIIYIVYYYYKYMDDVNVNHNSGNHILPLDGPTLPSGLLSIEISVALHM